MPSKILTSARPCGGADGDHGDHYLSGLPSCEPNDANERQKMITYVNCGRGLQKYYKDE